MTAEKERIKRIVAFSGGGIFIYLILGVYFKNSIGAWFAATYYILGFIAAGVGAFLFFKHKTGSNPTKQKSNKVNLP